MNILCYLELLLNNNIFQYEKETNKFELHIIIYYNGYTFWF